MKMKPEYQDESVNPIDEAKNLVEKGQGYICDFQSIVVENPWKAWCLHHGDFHPVLPATADEDHFFLPNLLAGSEYAVSRIHRANHRAFLERYEELQNVHRIHGNHETYGVAVGLDVKNGKLWKDLASLLDNPLLSEKALFNVELQERQDAWEEWAEYEYRRGLEKKYKVETCPVDTDTLREIFENAARWQNEQWVEGICGGWSYIDVDKVVEGTSRHNLIENGAIPLNAEE